MIDGPLRISLTGTPGTGKTTVADVLRKNGYEVTDVNEVARNNGLLREWDDDLETYEVDIGELASFFQRDPDETMSFLEGHLSHLLPCDIIIVLRCNPSVIGMRLESRGYSRAKVSENMEAEALDVILVESLETGRPVYEIDCSEMEPSQVSDSVMEIMGGEVNKYLPGNVDWSAELLKWC